MATDYEEQKFNKGNFYQINRLLSGVYSTNNLNQIAHLIVQVC
jgi:hypothetical protein